MWHASTVHAPGGIGHKSRLAALIAIGIAAFAAWRSSEAFTASVPQNRPAGHSVTVEKLPRGVVCRAAADDDWIPKTWNPITQWRGEKSWHPSKRMQADENRQWYHFDAEGKTLGHLSQAIAATLRGKHSPLYDPVGDVGAFVVVTNCEKVRVTGKKYHYKLYFRNLSFRPGSLKVERFKDLQKRFPERIIMKSVWGSMPKTPSCRRIFKERLKLFSGPNHLYYHKDPVEYPMHLVKDCTVLGNMPKRLHLRNRMNRLPREKELYKERAEKVLGEKLVLFKEFLTAQLEKEGDAAAERMSMDELAVAAQATRMQKKRDDNEGIPTPRRVVHTHLGLNIPKQKRVKSNRKVGVGGWN
mmetsp:Transcript_26313/g.61380  ORF Transcript_26313/g.61380 Transcript_26313/m.61380 type:complete len:356 (-) Transcript_26313:112-1179(-)|eukprot:CAMPEP_0171107294 /NCGR_PEP_ID=MMETSP0766_2-20121228/66486_1 /TAXON_ID=439317 /ORGANISM="Gambierdiscus australes, Strain CAWD 149" /LENGTH=355 /DNA_ID=CAMNT_0011568559 /DNA_START=48 /DNA_END=1115 /DNA_ORIENTATION=-